MALDFFQPKITDDRNYDVLPKFQVSDPGNGGLITGENREGRVGKQ